MRRYLDKDFTLMYLVFQLEATASGQPKPPKSSTKALFD